MAAKDKTPEEELGAQIAEAIETEKKTFVFKDKLRGFRKRSVKVVVFGDAEAVETFVEAERKLTLLAGAVAHSQQDPDAEQALRDNILKNHNEAEERLEGLREGMLASALSFHLRAVPNVAIKVARREARKVVGDNTGSDADDNYNDVFSRLILRDTIEKVVDSDGAESKPDLDDLEYMSNELDPLQWQRVIAKMNELNFIDGFAQQASDDPGF